jgi:GNAT superfamily N-acetyltransferase
MPIENIHIRKATRNDVIPIVSMLADDVLGSKREHYSDPLPAQYYTAFDSISSDPNNLIIVAVSDNKVIGTLQITFITYLTYQGGKRALIEAVRTDSACRGKGIGKIMFEWAISKAKEEGCHLVQLTTDKKRPDALEFYEKLGFKPSHEGLKLFLD